MRITLWHKYVRGEGGGVGVRFRVVFPPGVLSQVDRHGRGRVATGDD